MRIGVDIRALAEPRPTGVPVYVRHLCVSLEKHAATDTLVFFSSGTARRPTPPVSGAHAEYCHLRIPNKFLSASIRVCGWPKLDRFLNAETVLLPNLHFASVSPHARLIVVVHDLSFIHLPSSYSLRGRWWHKAVNVRKLLYRADAVIAVSHATRRDVIETFNIEEAKVHVVYPGVPQGPDTSTSDLDAVRAKFGISRQFILALGPLDPRKNLSCALEAFRRLPRELREAHQLVVTGVHSWRKDKLFRYLVQQMRNVSMVGFVTEKEKWALLRTARCFIYPSRYEGFGFPLVEAMTAGTAIIASHTSSIPEVVGEAGLVANPDDPGEFSAALRMVLTDNSLRDMLIRRGRERVKQFSWDTAAKNILCILHGERPV